MATARLSRKTMILFKTETIYNVDSTPTEALNAVMAIAPSLTPLETETKTYDVVRSYLGNVPNIVVAEHMMLEFSVGLTGAGSAGAIPKFSPLLRACGFAETVTAGVKVEYTPVSSLFESATIWVNMDGVWHKGTGCRGSVSIEVKAKELPVLKFKFTGNYVPVTDGVPATPVYTNWLVPEPANSLHTQLVSIFNGTTTYQPCLAELTADMANTITPRHLIGCDTVVLTDRKPTGNLVTQSQLVADKNWWQEILATQSNVVTLTHGTAAGKYIDLVFQKCQFTKHSYSEQEGIWHDQIPFNLLPLDGNDEILIRIR